MSLDAFFGHTVSSKKQKRDCKKEAKSKATKVNGSQSNELEMEDGTEQNLGREKKEMSLYTKYVLKLNDNCGPNTEVCTVALATCTIALLLL